ncbi:MAG: transcription-repair coupling factor [Planctomycetota bacterium]|nr:transcription-repair coupling factor [Planctomycetota bacterium]
MTTAGKQVPSTLAELTVLMGAAPGFAEVVASLHSGKSATIDGAWGSACALSLAAIAAADKKRTYLVVLPTIRDAEEFVDEISDLTKSPVILFPAWESLPDTVDAGDSVYAARLAAVRRLNQADRAPALIVTCVPALLQPVPARDAIRAATRTISVGDELNLDELIEWLIARGFDRVTAVELPGEFCIHGGILDIFPASEPDAIRIELFGDEIESIRSFNVESQRRLEDLKSISLTATAPTKIPSSGAASATQSNANSSTAKKSASAESDAPSPVFAGPTESLIDSLPPTTIVVLTDLHQSISEGRMYLQRLSSPVGLYGVDATMARLMEFPSVTIDALGADSYETSCHLSIEAIERLSGSRRDALVELSELLGPGDHVLLCCHNEGEHERLNELIKETDAAHNTTLGPRIQLTTGRLRRGFRLINHNLIVISDNELFSRATTRTTTRKRRADSRAIDTFLDLRDGDLVVHVAHGIAKYRGMTKVEDGGQQEEHMLLEFRDSVIVYVPVSLIHLVQKYIGPAKSTPELTKYGGTSWLKKKDQVAEAVSDMATDMLKLQAERASRPGLQCPPDSHLQQEFDKAFPFTETVDQVSAIADLKQDMEQPKPMDRLICGDVGFGKTEVAMRAVFKAVDAGRQVAVLVPTTVLAEQHFRTFSQRMAEFPVVVEMLSRFRSAAEQKRIIERLREGAVDVVIGTHRLVSKDIKFKNLGLLVIDEEQKFGVKVKERLKHIRAEVDVLTLTATPIPRTLHMSLLGIRDISSLTTPPRDRMPIETRVGRFDESLIRSAIIRELNRGGQVYFVHNRVHDIELIAQRLKRIVPEASLTIAHGQMHEDDLEAAMIQFVAGKADILLATTIIESGLDIPNANTMFIHQADIYGLADMHQLRGRVGRDRHRAYCYLLLEDGRVVTTKAMRRLKAIEEYSELGAGFRIALRDLEIRGAGNILGTEQSGNIAAVGYELYCQLLENSVRTLKKQPLRYQRHCKIELPVSNFIPDKYISEQKLKIEVYRRLSQANSLSQLSELEEELRDRFGPIPTAARRMLQLRELNLRALGWKIENIHLETGYAVLRYREVKLIRMLSHLHKGHLRVVDAHDAYWPLEAEETDGAAVLDELIAVLSAAEPPVPER